MKTIGFVISNQHLIPHGGIGQFCRSMSRMCSDLGHNFILITDQKPKKGFSQEINPAWNYYPSKPVSYEKHRAFYGRFAEGPNMEKVKNFQTAINNTLNGIFPIDMLIANSPESIPAVAEINLPIKKVLYTHIYKQVYPNTKFNDIFTDDYHTFFNRYFHHPFVTVGTQTEHNKKLLLDQNIKSVEVLPMPITEPELLIGSDHEQKSGVLFVGRWEDAKNPKDYLKVMKECELPCKVMTNKNGAKKFEKAFKELGIKDYDIRASIIGKEKIDFIKSCKVFFNTAIIECTPNSVYETIGHMPVVSLTKSKVAWAKNYEGHVLEVDVKNAAKVLYDYYYQKVDNIDGLAFANTTNELAYEFWDKFITT